MPDDDPEIEALDLAASARTAAYALKKAHSEVKFTSGRRDRAGQAHAMAGNVVANRQWIQETYKESDAKAACQRWVNEHPEATTIAAIAAGLTTVLTGLTDAQAAKLSKHLSGEAFDVQPVQQNAAAIIATIRSLPGLGLFLEKEGGLVRWHAQF